MKKGAKLRWVKPPIVLVKLLRYTDRGVRDSLRQGSEDESGKSGAKSDKEGVGLGTFLDMESQSTGKGDIRPLTADSFPIGSWYVNPEKDNWVDTTWSMIISPTQFSQPLVPPRSISPTMIPRLPLWEAFWRIIDWVPSSLLQENPHWQCPHPLHPLKLPSFLIIPLAARENCLVGWLPQLSTLVDLKTQSPNPYLAVVLLFSYYRTPRDSLRFPESLVPCVSWPHSGQSNFLSHKVATFVPAGFLVCRAQSSQAIDVASDLDGLVQWPVNGLKRFVHGTARLTGKIGCRVKNHGVRKYKLPEIVVGLHSVGLILTFTLPCWPSHCHFGDTAPRIARNFHSTIPSWRTMSALLRALCLTWSFF